MYDLIRVISHRPLASVRRGVKTLAQNNNQTKLSLDTILFSTINLDIASHRAEANVELTLLKREDWAKIMSFVRNDNLKEIVG